MGKILIILALLLPATSYGLTDKQVVALTLLGEARGEGTTGIYAVANVIANRAHERHLTPRKICLQKLQFSFWNDPRTPAELNRLLRGKQGTYALRLASAVVSGRKLKDITGGANHYHAVSIDPPWRIESCATVTIKRHRFYRI